MTADQMLQALANAFPGAWYAFKTSGADWSGSGTISVSTSSLTFKGNITSRIYRTYNNAISVSANSKLRVTVNVGAANNANCTIDIKGAGSSSWSSVFNYTNHTFNGSSTSQEISLSGFAGKKINLRISIWYERSSYETFASFSRFEIS